MSIVLYGNDNEKARTVPEHETFVSFLMKTWKESHKIINPFNCEVCQNYI